MTADHPSRRDLLRGGLAAGASATAASVTATGCATMPRAGGAPTAHPCDHRFCRYHDASRGVGRCTLALRLAGGEP